ncbi:MAG: 16S rRNA (cytosine(1402)-N(4))-methyltransferase RsmH [Thermoguttaceae bacterium]|jgi:16S rRNA (cytosine1402-N4)-methyltransferase
MPPQRPINSASSNSSSSNSSSAAGNHINPATPTVHVPVLLEEVLEWLQPRPGGVAVDGTLGGGGHTRALAQRVGPAGLVVAMDRDAAAVDAARDTLAGLPVKPLQGNFCDLPEVLEGLGIAAVDAILLDLGVSSDQLSDPERGFSFSSDGPLDLRFDAMRGEPARRLINRLSAEHLADLIYYYGEERYSRRIARAIVQRRRDCPIETSAELAELVRRCVPRSRKEQIDPATRTFQALRIAVNDELKSLEIALRRLPGTLHLGGRLAVISFHSLEDRRVKEAFRDDPRLKALVRKPITPSPGEIHSNPRSRSAKLRVAERV